MFTIVVAYTKTDRVIGKNGKIPWSLPEDLAHFKELTLGKTVIMGRKTWESLPARYRPLPDRHNIVLSRHPFTVHGAHELYPSIDELVDNGPFDAFVIGGAEIYEQFLERKFCHQVIATEIKKCYDGDTYFPLLNASHWNKRIVRSNNDFDIIEYNR